jgi:hypothetical protein
MAIRKISVPDDGPCYVCGRLLVDHSRRERRCCERQPLPILIDAPRAARNRARRRWWHR